MIRKSKKKPELGGPTVPAYIVTFSDMVTLLLTFFVMLLSLSKVQDPELFHRSRDAFIEHIDCYGLGMLTGKQFVPDFSSMKAKFNIPDPDEDAPARTIDSKEENLRRLFRKVRESMQAIPSRAHIRLSDYVVTSISFPPGGTELNEAAESYLTQYAIGLRGQSDSGKIEVYILGLACDEPIEKQRWVISSLRAQKVTEYLRKTGLECPIYYWGAGSGGRWVDRSSPVSEQSQIFIAVLRTD